MTARGAGRRGTARVPLGALLAAGVLAAGPGVGGSAAAAPAADVEQCLSGAEDEAADPWHVDHLGLDVLAETWRGWGVRIAVVSSGVDGDHAALAGHVGGGAAVGTRAEPQQDCLGLGTAAAGAAAAAVAPGSQLPGVAPQSLVLPVRVPDALAGPRDPAALPEGASATLGAAIEAAADAEADVILVTAVLVPDSPSLRAAVDRAEERGALVVQGVPSGDRPERLRYPLAYPEVVGVAGHDRDGAAAPDVVDADLVDLLAPGVDVPVPVPGGYATVTHPDVGAGLVAGATALLVESEPALAAGELRTRLLARAPTPVPTGPGSTATPLLSPAAVLGPAGSGEQPPAGDAGAGYRGPAAAAGADPARAASLLIAVLAVTALAAGLLAAVTVRRGVGRRWRPASGATPPTDATASPTPIRKA